MVGLFNAVEMITGGESLTARQAAAMGWADDVVASDQLLAAAMRMVRDEQQSQAFRRDREPVGGSRRYLARGDRVYRRGRLGLHPCSKRTATIRHPSPRWKPCSLVRNSM